MRFGRTQDRGNGENSCTVSTLPTKQQHIPYAGAVQWNPHATNIVNENTQDENSYVYHVIAAGESCRPAWALSSSTLRLPMPWDYCPSSFGGSPIYLVKVLFSFRGVDEVEVPQDRNAAK